jgi:hypothetical protein
MRKLFSSHKRFIGLGLMSALVIALAVVGALWGSSQSASAQSPTPTPPSVTLVHVEPIGIDYTGNPYCPDTIWTGTKKPVVNPWHDCNNITSQYHVIRTEGWVIGTSGYSVNTWNIENFSGAVATIQAQGRCGDLLEVTGRAGWTTANNDEWCVIIHSSMPGETRVTLSYTVIGDGTFIAGPVVKEWDSLTDSVILKYGDGDLEKVKVYYGGTTLYKELYLPKDMNGDTVRDYRDEALLDKQSVWQEHPVVWDEARKRVKSAPPVQIIEVVHGEHDVLINGVSITTHQPTEGALVLAVIESPRFCTFFTNGVTEDCDGDTALELPGTCNYGATVTGVSDNLGRFTFPPPDPTAGGLGVYVDTVCEEQAEIHFYAQYPNLPGSLRLGLHEWVGINWTTIELAKQPQIRWAGEEIVLEKRWALPDEWFPNVNTNGTLMDICPHVFNFARYNRLITSSAGDLVGGIPEMFEPYTQPDRLITIVDVDCISRALASSEDQGEGDFEVTIHDWDYEDADFSADEERDDLQDTLDALNADILAGKMSAGAAKAIIYDDYYESEWLGEMFLDPDAFDFSEVLNKHAFLVWWLKIYQTKLTNVDGAREFHNNGAWTSGDGEDTEADTLNVSADTLLRVKVKGWFEGGNNSSRGAVCVDLDGDGDGIDNDGDTLFGEDKKDDVDNDADTKVDEDLEAGVPYPISSYEAGCPDPGDEMLPNGAWVLPDDLPALAGPDAIHTRPNWDVMSEADDAYTGAIGPKSTLDSHDPVLRIWVGYKTVVPDGAITAADAIMPPLKIRASIADNKDATVDDGESGYLKEALKGIVYASSNDYRSIMIPASPWIPAMVNDGGYDWSSWTLPACPDSDVGKADGVCDADDLCPADFDPTNGDLDSDGTGDVCDADADGDTILDDGDDSGVIGDAPCINGDLTVCDDNCRWKANATQVDADSDGIGTACDMFPAVLGTPATDLDSDGDTVLDITDNCDRKSNATQTDTDGDGYGDTCDPKPGLAWDDRAAVPYPFWTIINKFERQDAKETVDALKKRPWYIEFYTDNRGEGMFFANGDFNLSYDDCRADPVSGAPDCSPGKVVGESNIKVIGDYPYYRKHTSVQSNPVVKTWEWGGFKDVEAVRIDANHTAIIAHLLDRDGFCKYAVKADPTAAKGVTTSPSLHPVQGEEIEFILNTDIGRIIEVSPNGVYQPPAPHDPLTDARVVRLEDGTIIDRSEAVALAEDGRVLGFFGEARGIDEGLVAEEDCQAWIVIEHPLGEEPNVSVRFHDPEGVILRHWPPSELTVSLVQYWNDSCYAGPSQPVEEAMADIIDNVLAVYRYTAEQTWEGYFPGRCEEAEGLCTLETLEPYDQLFILMSASADWLQVIQAPPTSADLVEAWNSICYTGVDKATEEAVRDIESAFAIMYQLGSDQAWRRYVPARPEIPDTLTTLHMFDSVVLLVTTEGGITWTFDP